MKTKTTSIVVATVFALSLGVAYAESKDSGADHPCKKIMEACKAAGFAKGQAKEGKGLFKNCMHPIMEGKTVSGVSVDAATVQACQAKRATWKEHHGAAGNGAKAPAGK